MLFTFLDKILNVHTLFFPDHCAHCAQMHRNFIGTDRLTTTEEVRAGFKFILLESLGEEASIEDLKRKEDVWRTRLDSWAPSGLNTRDD